MAKLHMAQASTHGVRKPTGPRMASLASSATTCGARKHAWTKKMLKEEEDFALAGLVLIVDSRTNFMFAGAACTGKGKDL